MAAGNDDLDDLDGEHGIADADATALSDFEDFEDGPGGGGGFDKKAFALALAALLALLAFHAFSLRSWIRKDARPPSWDQSIHLEIAKDVDRALERGDWKTILLPGPKPGMPPFPPLHYLLTHRAMDAPEPAKAALWVNMFYMAVLCVSLFGIGRRFSDDWGGAAAALLFSCMPEVQWLLRDQIIDLGLTAAVAAAYWALLSSERFERMIPSVLFGFLFGCSMLIKWSAFSYFIPVLGLALGEARDGGRAGNMKYAAAAAFVLAGPWYLLNWPVLLPRLVDASSDNAVSLASWRGLTAYIGQMPIGMEFPLFAVGLAALSMRPRFEKARGDASLLLFWFAASFVFWTVVPNRQLRYLLPALAPLVLMIPAVYGKKGLAALCALQLFAAANYANGWVGHRSAGLLLFNLSFFRQDAPKREDWKTEEILRKAEELHDKERPFGNMALLANAKFYNGALFNWELARTGIETIRMRGINRRICEFAEFLLTKTGELGPESVVNQLPDVRKRILAKRSWFLRGYKQAAEFPLPDGTRAILYQLRRPQAAPLGEGLARFDYVDEKDLTIEKARIDLGRYDPKRGVYPKVRVRADRFVIRGLEIRDLDVELEDFLAVSVTDPRDTERAMRESLLMDVRLLRVKRLTLRSASVSPKALEEFIKARVPDARSVSVEMDRTIVARANIRGFQVSAEAGLNIAENGAGLNISLIRASAAGVPLPVFLLGPHRSYFKSFAPDPEIPFEIGVKALTLSGGLRIRG